MAYQVLVMGYIRYLQSIKKYMFLDKVQTDLRQEGDRIKHNTMIEMISKS